MQNNLFIRPTKKLLSELFISQDHISQDYYEYFLYVYKFCGFNNKSTIVYSMTLGLSKFIGDT